MNVAGRGNADFNETSVARKSPSSIRCVAITTRRRYHKSLLSHRRNFRTPSITKWLIHARGSTASCAI